jgi:hypothetical protein
MMHAVSSSKLKCASAQIEVNIAESHGRWTTHVGEGILTTRTEQSHTTSFLSNFLFEGGNFCWNKKEYLRSSFLPEVAESTTTSQILLLPQLAAATGVLV